MSLFDDRDVGESDSSFEETSDDDDNGSDIEASNEDIISSEEDDIIRVENENIQHSDEDGLEVINPDKDNNNQVHQVQHRHLLLSLHLLWPSQCHFYLQTESDYFPQLQAES